MILVMDEIAAAFLERAVVLATQSVAAGGGPFGALLVLPDGRRFHATNRVTLDNDPTAHAEVSVIRLACAKLGTYQLTGAVLYSSCEPCPMCLAAALWARVERVYYAADRYAAARAGFDDAAFYDYLEGRSGQGLMPVRQLTLSQAEEPFDAWRSSEQRVEY